MLALGASPPTFSSQHIKVGYWLDSCHYYKLILDSSVHKTFFHDSACSFKSFLANRKLTILFLWLTWGLHLTVQPLHFCSSSLPTVVIDKATPDSWRMFLICWMGVWGFFFVMERIHLSSATKTALGLPVPLWLESSPVFFFFLNYFLLWFSSTYSICREHSIWNQLFQAQFKHEV